MPEADRIETDELLGVSDEGPGLDGLDPAQMVEPFFTTRPDRAGLGLAVAKQIAVDHGFDLDWRNAQPEGLRARIVTRTGTPAQRREW